MSRSSSHRLWPGCLYGGGAQGDGRPGARQATIHRQAVAGPPVSCVSPRVQPPHAPWKGCRPVVPSAAAEGRAAPGAAGTQFSRPPPPLRGPWRCWGPKCQRADPATQVALLERRSLVLSNSIPFFSLNITCIVLSLSVLRFSRGRELRLRRARRADVAASRGQDAVWRGGSCACGRFRRRACSLPASGLATISLP